MLETLLDYGVWVAVMYYSCKIRDPSKGRYSIILLKFCIYAWQQVSEHLCLLNFPSLWIYVSVTAGGVVYC